MKRRKESPERHIRDRAFRLRYARASKESVEIELNEARDMVRALEANLAAWNAEIAALEKDEER